MLNNTASIAAFRAKFKGLEINSSHEFQQLQIDANKAAERAMLIASVEENCKLPTCVFFIWGDRTLTAFLGELNGVLSITVTAGTKDPAHRNMEAALLGEADQN